MEFQKGFIFSVEKYIYMPRAIKIIQSGEITHEGATQYVISNPLLDLVFTKGAVRFTKGFYQSQQDEIISFIKALKDAEVYEKGFGWKYGVYVRHPKLGKGNRIQGSVVPAVLSSFCGEDTYSVDFIKEYVKKSLLYRPDDVVLFVSHWENLDLGGIESIPPYIKEAIASTLEEFTDYQILKYRNIEVDRTSVRFKKDICGNEISVPKTLRLVDVMGLCYKQLSSRLKNIYAVLHTSKSKISTVIDKWPAYDLTHSSFKNKEYLNISDFAPSISQALSVFGNNKKTWESLFNSNLVPDMAFLLNIRNMGKAGYSPEELIEKIGSRQFNGIWPHQVYAGYKAVTIGSYKKNYVSESMPEYGQVFNKIFLQIVKNTVPSLRGLGFADVSGSMFTKVSKENSLTNMDIAKLLCACVATTSGYAATFDDNAHIAKFNKDHYVNLFDFVLRHRAMNCGLGSTQVYGSIIDTLNYIIKYSIKPFKIVYFFSDMQFHPPTVIGESLYYRKFPPLELALKKWRDTFNETPLIVLWNLASYEGSPLECSYPGVAFVSGYDVNIFKHLQNWIANGGNTISKSQ